ncbi:MAG TPA: tyrosine-type recombinase/integrase [Mycobacteriales bacterium]|nr:tyrosine-type recombinase/integrase [Mycobacteriales bacterium]
MDRYLVFVASRARPNTVLATVSDLRAFFAVVSKDPREVRPGDVLDFIAEQRRPRGDANVVRLVDGRPGLSSQTIKRRLSSVSGLFSWLLILGEVDANPVPRGLSTRRVRGPGSTVPLVRAPRTLPRVLEPGEVDALLGALRRWRDRAMVEAMVLGGLRRCEVLGLRTQDLRPAEGRVFIADGKGGHQRLVPISKRFFRSLGHYLGGERPEDAGTEFVFVALKGPTRGRPLTADGLDEIVRAAKVRAKLNHATCHELRHTCLTRLREAGMALEAIQAQAGHRSIESTRLYLHLSNEWLASEYLRAATLIDGSALAGVVSS